MVELVLNVAQLQPDPLLVSFSRYYLILDKKAANAGKHYRNTGSHARAAGARARSFPFSTRHGRHARTHAEPPTTRAASSLSSSHSAAHFRQRSFYGPSATLCSTNSVLCLPTSWFSDCQLAFASNISMRITVFNSSNALATFEHDVNLSAATKRECLKFLSVILKNLGKDDPKYRVLRLSNAKIQRLTTTHPAVMSYLQSIGFATVQEDGESVLRCATPPANLGSELAQVTAAYDRVAPAAATVSHSSSAASLPELSEKQKARKLKEEKEAMEKEASKLARKRTREQIKADKHVRENDPNWKPTVSAAAAKSGDSMSTFRDKFGEN